MPKYSEFTSKSNNNRFTYRIYKNQICVSSYNTSTSNNSCLGGITGKMVPNTADVFRVQLYASKSGNGNNHLIFNQEEIDFYLTYIQSLYPLFTWRTFDDPNYADHFVIDLTFEFDELANSVECNQMKIILNLIRHLFENPRTYQLKHAIELFKQKWHNLDLYQLILLMELTEYSSTNDHKLISGMITILPTEKEIVKRSTQISGIYNSHRLPIEEHSSGNYVQGYNTFSSGFPIELDNPEFQKRINYLLSAVNERRKQLKLNEF